MPPYTDTPKADKTRNDIMRAAEQLFAEKGFRAMTLRDVTREAQVNLAAVNYHFGSKRNLMLAVIRNRFEPINVERLKQLDALIEQYSPAPIPVHLIFDALIRPLFESASRETGPDYGLMQMIGRAITEPADFISTIHKELIAELSLRFMAELQRSCPDISASLVSSSAAPTAQDGVPAHGSTAPPERAHGRPSPVARIRRCRPHRRGHRGER